MVVHELGSASATATTPKGEITPKRGSDTEPEGCCHALRSTDPGLSRLYARAAALLRTAPDGDTGGIVEIRRYQDEAGRVSYTVNQYSNHGL